MWLVEKVHRVGGVLVPGVLKVLIERVMFGGIIAGRINGRGVVE